MEENETENKPILHILVIGFHHKLGCQVEFSYPPLIVGSTGVDECPAGWKYLPTLALPDGSHNFQRDTVFFNLPSLSDPTKSVYGVSCYRQIPVENLKNRTSDVTRNSVQKTVCILARLPIYGYIEVKLSLIADTFFDQGDFSRTKLLSDAYKQLNACLCDESTRPLSYVNVGLPLREITLQWRHKLLILFKLFLLERRVVCFSSPCRAMCVLILSVVSLVPRLLEKGFQEVACVRTTRPLSPMPDFTDSIQQETAAALAHHEQAKQQLNTSSDATSDCNWLGGTGEPATSMQEATITEADNVAQLPSECAGSNCTSTPEREKQRVLDREPGLLARDGSVEGYSTTLSMLSLINPDEYRAPVSIFTSGNMCLPYLSLPYMQLLSDASVQSYVIGTSNVLFQQKRQLYDVLIDVENAVIEANDPELRRQLALSTEDLRFMDFLLRHVQAPREDEEGSERWVREQFQGYLLALLRTAVADKDNEHFNVHFMAAFKKTQCFQEWFDVKPSVDFFESLPAGHPFAGNLSVADIKLKFAQTMQNSKSGHKINDAVNAMGGAFSQARSTLTNLWSSITTSSGAPAAGNASEVLEGNAVPLAQEISVTFQNSSNVDDIKVGVKGVGKLVDCAEEIGEDVTPAATPPPAEFNTILPTTETEQKGIVEIGREADILDKCVTVQTTCGTASSAVASAERPAPSSGSPFIV